MLALLFLIAVILSATSSFGISLRFGEGCQLEGLGVHIGVSGGLRRRQSTLESRDLCYGDRVGERDRKLDEHVSKLMGSLMEGKALLTHGLQIVRFDHLSRIACDSNIVAIQVLDHEVDAGQSFIEGDFVLKKDISTLPLELLMGLFLNDNDNVAGFSAGCLIGFTVEGVLAVVRSTLIDHRIEDLLLLVHLLALAGRAPVGLIDDLTLSTAVVAGALGLGVHTGSELGHLHDDTATTAGCALLNSAFSSSPALANLADSLSVHCNFCGLAIENLLKGAFEWVHDGLALFRPATLASARTTHAEHLLKDATTPATSASLFDSLGTVLVVKFTLLTIAQHLVGLLDFLELVFVTTTIGMMGSGELMVSFLDCVEVGSLLNAEGFVEAFVVDLLGLAATTSHAAHFLEVSEWETSSSSSKEHYSVCCCSSVSEK